MQKKTITALPKHATNNGTLLSNGLIIKVLQLGKLFFGVTKTIHAITFHHNHPYHPPPSFLLCAHNNDQENFLCVL